MCLGLCLVAVCELFLYEYMDMDMETGAELTSVGITHSVDW